MIAGLRSCWETVNFVRLATAWMSHRKSHVLRRAAAQPGLLALGQVGPLVGTCVGGNESSG